MPLFLDLCTKVFLFSEYKRTVGVRDCKVLKAR